MLRNPCSYGDVVCHFVKERDPMHVIYVSMMKCQVA